MSIPQFDNPLERLSVLPNVINWKGEWVSGSQYYMNDVVSEPSTTAAFILTGATALLSETTPSTDAQWSQLAATSSGVITIDPGAGISVTGPSTNPTISNTGVLEILPGTNINIDGTTNPIISCSAIQEILAGNSGISIGGLPNPIITNTGVRTITAGAGISSSGGPNPSLTNTGVISIEAGDGIEVLGLPNPIVSNTGVLSIIPGAGVTVSPLDGKGDVTVSAATPLLTTVIDLGGNPSSALITNPTPIPAGVVSPATPGISEFLAWPIASLSNGIFKTYLANGAPTPNGVFLIDMTSFNLIFTGSGTADGAFFDLRLQFIDQTTAGGPYTYTVSANIVSSIATFPFPFNLGQLYFDVAAARTAGLRTIDTMNIVNYLTSTIVLLSGTSPYAIYYPNGPE